MPVKKYTGAAVLGTILACLVGDASIAPAEARDYYTRKRVNGVWITGVFKYNRSARTEEPAAGADAAAAERPTGAPAGPPGDDRPPFQRAAEARRPAIDLAFAEPPAVEPVLLPLRRALETRARLMAVATTGSIAPGRAVRSVTLDFENRRRVIHFMDGSRREEPLGEAGAAVLNADAMP